MKKYYLLTLLITFTHLLSLSQPCLSEGIIFSTQEEIDNFQANYPGCTQIEGNVKIDGDSINNLNGLNILTDIYGSLWIRSCDQLNSLNGLNNVQSIGEFLRLDWNEVLENVDGLNNLNSIGGYLCLWSNANLSDLSGLSNLNSIGGELEIVNNSSLTNLSGLDNIDPASITNLYIYLNSSLTNGNVQSICSYLSQPNGIVGIYNNAQGSNNPAEIAASCGFTLDCLPYGNYYIFSQEEVDNFQTNYPGCTNPNGKLIIEGDDITSLTGLNNISSVSGDLVVGRQLSGGVNPLLTYLNGLDNLDTIFGSLKIVSNEALLGISGLSQLIHIEQDLDVTSNHEILSIAGLAGISSVSGNVRIGFTDHLPSLTGLENLATIGGSLIIDENDGLSDLTGLDNLQNIDGGLDIWGNDILMNLSGLDQLITIGGGLYIHSTHALTKLSGLENLNSIGGQFVLEYNNALNNLEALTNLSSIQGDLNISYNSSLQTLSGLDNIEPGSIDKLLIFDNQNLSSCEINSICNYLSNPNGMVIIFNNSPGCDNPAEIANACGFTLPCLPYGNYYIMSQDDADDFFVDYPGCFELNGYLNIQSDDITDLSGLYGITSIEEDLFLNWNMVLQDFTGLESLTSIGGNFYIGHWVGGNPVLIDFSGLESLERIGKSLTVNNNHALTDLSGIENLRSIGSLSIITNNSLESLSGLDNLDSIHGELSINSTTLLGDLHAFNNLKYVDGYIEITNNQAIISLSGLDNIVPNSIDNLWITNNSLLASCAVNSICEYLADSGSVVAIGNNAPGCDSQEEVEMECTINIPEKQQHTNILIYPNPAKNEILISTPEHLKIDEICIYNQLGQIVLKKTGITDKINVSELPKSLYIIELISNSLSIKKKVLIGF